MAGHSFQMGSCASHTEQHDAAFYRDIFFFNVHKEQK